jgi:hypothetical protein
MIPTIIFVGCLYASVTGRFIFFRMFKDSVHLTSHTVKGWAWWGFILFLSWAASFLIAEVIPFFSSCKSLPSSLVLNNTHKHYSVIGHVIPVQLLVWLHLLGAGLLSHAKC